MVAKKSETPLVIDGPDPGTQTMLTVKGKTPPGPNSPAAADIAGVEIRSHEPGSTAVGKGAGAGLPAAANNVTAAGSGAAQTNTGASVTAVGFAAAQNNTGSNVAAVGVDAAHNNTGHNVTAMGRYAAQKNTAQSVSAYGYNSAVNNRGAGLVAVGTAAAQNNTGKEVTAVGPNSAQNNTSNGTVAVGFQAALNSFGEGVTAVGDNAQKTVPNTAAMKTFNVGDVDVKAKTIIITGHGLGAAGAIFPAALNTLDPAGKTPVSSGDEVLVHVVDANTLTIPLSTWRAPSGTQLTLTPMLKVDHATAIGANAVCGQSNSIQLGNNTITVSRVGVGNDRLIPLAELKGIAAASADFNAFKTAIATMA